MTVNNGEFVVNRPDLKDYKFFCFDGIVKMIQVDYNRFVHHNRNLYTPEWKRMDSEIGFPSLLYAEFEKPQVLDKAIQIAQHLSEGIPHVRVDLYIINTSVYFGELTFYHGSGFEHTKPKNFDTVIGDWLALPKNT